MTLTRIPDFVLRDYPRALNVPMRRVPEEELVFRRCDSPISIIVDENGVSPLELPIVVSRANPVLTENNLLMLCAT